MAFIPERITVKVASVMMFSLPGHISGGGSWTCPVARHCEPPGHERQSENQATDDEIQMVVAKAETAINGLNLIKNSSAYPALIYDDCGHTKSFHRVKIILLLLVV
jgi:hypothetical protein